MTLEHYYNKQIAAMATAADDAPSAIDGWDLPLKVEIRYIDKEAIVAQSSWYRDGHDYLWSEVACMKFRQPNVIDFAIWYEGQLCGLCCAFAWPESGAIQIEALQGNPRDDHKLKARILPLALYVLSAYGIAVDASEIVVNQPEEGSSRAYLKNGFAVEGSGFAYAIPGV